jgi:short-subunit dehydrogenase
MNILITGASRGIGYELVSLFSKDKSNKVIAIARNAEKLKKMAQSASFANVIALPLDLSEESQVEKVGEFVKQNVSSIDIVINNAGAIVNKPFMELKIQDIKTVYQVNVFSVFGLIKQLLPLMNTQNKSHIVNISSVGGYQGSVKFAGLSAYSSSKAALVCLTECLAVEFKDKNIAFNCLALGATQTEMLEEAFPGYKAPLSAKEMAEFIMNFSLTAQVVMNGKVIPVSLSTP